MQGHGIDNQQAGVTVIWVSLKAIVDVVLNSQRYNFSSS